MAGTEPQPRWRRSISVLGDVQLSPRTLAARTVSLVSSRPAYTRATERLQPAVSLTPRLAPIPRPLADLSPTSVVASDDEPAWMKDDALPATGTPRLAPLGRTASSRATANADHEGLPAAMRRERPPVGALPKSASAQELKRMVARAMSHGRIEADVADDAVDDAALTPAKRLIRVRRRVDAARGGAGVDDDDRADEAAAAEAAAATAANAGRESGEDQRASGEGGEGGGEDGEGGSEGGCGEGGGGEGGGGEGEEVAEGEGSAEGGDDDSLAASRRRLRNQLAALRQHEGAEDDTARFLFSCKRSDLAAMATLHEGGFVDLAARNGFGRDAAQIAARNGRTDVLRWLRDNYAPLDSVGPRHGDNSLHLAVWNGP